MSTLARVEAPADAELISAVRGGDVDAYGELFARHVEAARRLARQLVPGSDSDDLVSEAFGWNVVLKATADHLRQRPDLAHVQRGISDAAHMREAWEAVKSTIDHPRASQP